MKNISYVAYGFMFSVMAGMVSMACAAEIQLYDTGPSEESSYVRFINATDSPISITSSKGAAKITLGIKDDGRVTHFFTVKSGTTLSASIQSQARKVTVDVVGKPWEYLTISVLPEGAKKIKTMLVRETPTDFNAMRASLALFNLDENCGVAAMQGGAKNTTILEGIKPFTVQRRLINPVKLAATLGCGKGSTGLDIPQLEAGGRYSVFLLTLKNAQQAFIVRDLN